MTLPRHMLRSTAYDLSDALDVHEFFQQKGWTDGLPIVPPAEEWVIECLQAAGLTATDIVESAQTWGELRHQRAMQTTR